ncbi:non-specific lipid-transfer protein-like [Pollicipes pollicipes]|uniref:non-specific lipid-transfer protein-like n=1 Tax=Pollicipes pollicipes TaxID=41117 RepID=UPI001884E7C1|nr:non-specific lipid-transfer protein-like [Pollicipes pollicipes]XP_037088688.1 non-specific lipid-transfer protein-like [Pollicipes pollicipes]XP_037088689.1 non-specific lipid-transfer protein-like [Pollicipes pollicipes]XP_037088690.1 non-specific lipid-transfer protein-like [Pollicipes pollicipes]XP_037088691.1 non-specific lipid-transfer protein-like [Pollicipes pollicipes]XP_037088692.1 non-specific lipid-transfer protein-like [Pollicipes pollicipes]
MVAASPDFKSSEIFEQMDSVLKTDGADIVKKMKAVFAFSVKNSGGKTATWTVDVKNGNGGVELNSNKKADVTLTLSDADLVDLMMGKLDAQKAFFQGKLKIKGNMGLALRLKTFQSEMDKYKAKL